MLKDRDVELLRRAVNNVASSSGCSEKEISKYENQFIAIAKGEDISSDVAKMFKELFESSNNFWTKISKISKTKDMRAYKFASIVVTLASCNYVETGKFKLCGSEGDSCSIKG